MGGGVPTLDRRYLSWVRVPTLDRGYLPWPGVPILAGEYLPWMKVPTLDGGTYPGQGVPTFARRDTYLGQRVPRQVSPTKVGTLPPWLEGRYPTCQLEGKYTVPLAGR